jgi:trehalose 6-phosphate synthase/phosphatase
MDRLLIVSNRLPVTVTKKENGIEFRESIGGLATGLSSFYESHNSKWIGWSGIPSEKLTRDEENILKKRLTEEFSNYPVFLSENDISNYYYGFCNRTIWPLFHSFTQYVEYDSELWRSYKRVNEIFCSEITYIAEPDDTLWIHDYQLMLLPHLVREKIPDITIGFFLHIPFPPFEIFHLLPWRDQILQGLWGADLIGFHTYDYAQKFLSSVRRLLGYEPVLGRTIAEDRVVKVDSFPMGIDYDRYESAVTDPTVEEELTRIHEEIGDHDLILSMDRLDYTKGILQRLDAFDYFLEENPDYREKATLMLVASPSRTEVGQYQDLKKRLEERIGRINGKYGTIEWTPVRYMHQIIPFETLIALYKSADVALITPLRDGMNLMAKEFLATKTDGKGVLILSEMAGAARELGEALIVNPNNKEEIAEALKKALSMPEVEQKKHNRAMQKRLKRYDVVRWANDFMDNLTRVKEMQKTLGVRKLTPSMKKDLFTAYRESESRLMLLDYDGTLVPFEKKPEKARPDTVLVTTLEALCRDEKNYVVIVSGRDRETLDRWFADLDLALIAEHGVWIKEKDGDWEMIENLENEWKGEIKPILELYVDRTPGSFIEEKEFSLGWHSRGVDNHKLRSVRARELKESLVDLTANLGLRVLEGDKVIEVKHQGVDKGRAAQRIVSKTDWEFILAIGDDWTDEDMFGVLPEETYSMKVGLQPTKANYNLYSVEEARSLLERLLNTTKE